MKISGKIRRVFAGEQGLRAGWRVVLGILAYTAAFYASVRGMKAAFGALFDGWGLTQANLHLAPAWAQAVAAGHTDAVYALAYALSGLAAWWFGKNRTKSAGKQTGVCAIAGFAAGLILALFALLTDSMRLERPFGEPSFSVWHLTSLAVLALGAVSGEILVRRMIFAAVKARCGRFPGYAAAAAAAIVLSGGWSCPLSVASVLLMAAACCAAYERGGLTASSALQLGWTAATGWLLAWPGQGISVYRMYHVSDAWLTGGNGGALCGVGGVVVWGCIAAALLWPELRRLFVRINKGRKTKDGKDQNCNRGSGLQRR